MVPACPVCGGPMVVNLRHNEFFVEDESWHKASERYGNYLAAVQGKAVVCLELGVGYNTPGIIRYPFEKIAYQNASAMLVRMNRDDTRGLPENEQRTVAFDEDMSTVVRALGRA